MSNRVGTSNLNAQPCWHWVGLALLLLCGCRGAAAQQEPSGEIYKSPQGVLYEVTHVGHFKPEQLPQNSDLKMADGDLVKYAGSACVLDVPPNTAPARCDLYVQPDKGGTLIGYAAVSQFSDSVTVETEATLNQQKEAGGGECGLSGKIYASSDPVKDASKDFNGSITYSAWEKSPGEFLISQVGPSDQPDLNSESALGVWYISKKGDKLRISQERWNYCYRNKNINIDDVFYRAVSLVRTSRAN